MLTIDDQCQPLVAIFAAGLEALLQWCQTHPDAPPQELLDRTAALAKQTERAVFAAAVERAGQYEPAPDCPHCARPMHGHGAQPRSLVTERGELRGPYRRFRCPDCGHLACPRLAAWGAEHGCSPGVAQVACALAVAMPYRVAERALGRLGISLSDNTLQRLVGRLGGALAEGEEAAAEALAKGQPAAPTPARPARLYLLHDAVKARVEGQWKNVRLGVTYQTAAAPMDEEGQVPPAEAVRVHGWLADSDTFLARFYPPALAAGLTWTEEVVLLQDGEEGLWERLPQLVPPGTPQVQILDFYHAAENLAKAVRAVCGEGTAATSLWFERLRRRLRAGDSVALFDGLRTLQSRAEGEAQRVVSNAIAYLRRHRQRIDYQRLHWEGYHIGSGQIESRCKQVGQRLKRSGANWSRAGLRSMLALQGHCLSYPDQPFPTPARAA